MQAAATRVREVGKGQRERHQLLHFWQKQGAKARGRQMGWDGNIQRTINKFTKVRAGLIERWQQKQRQ